MRTAIKVLALAAIVLLSSCGSNMLIVKRKYNKGFYVNTGGKVKNHEAPVIKTESEDIVASAQDETVVSTDMPVTANAENAIVIAKKDNSFSSIRTTSSPVLPAAVSSEKEKNAAAKIQKRLKHLEAKAAKKQKRKQGSDGNVVLLVILSLFPLLSLLAMYLKDGHQVTTNFWVDLLLTFIGLWWLFALLVVFDVVDLS